MREMIVQYDDPAEIERLQRDYSERLCMLAAAKKAAIQAGIPALHRLVEIADRDSGQALRVRCVLLSLYSSYRFPFPLVTLRSLDKEILDDCLAVINLDASVRAKEINEYIDNGRAIWERWATTTDWHEC